MARASSDVSRAVCANTIQANERKLREARIKNQVLRHRAVPPIFLYPVRAVFPAEEDLRCPVSVLFTLFLGITLVSIIACFHFPLFSGKKPNQTGSKQIVWQTQPSRGGKLAEVFGQVESVVQQDCKYCLYY